MKLTKEQELEIFGVAKHILKQRKLEELNWVDAWSGVYPDDATDSEICAEFDLLASKVIRLMSGDVALQDEYATCIDAIRMIYLEDCKTFNIWNLDTALK